MAWYSMEEIYLWGYWLTIQITFVIFIYNNVMFDGKDFSAFDWLSAYVWCFWKKIAYFHSDNKDK